MTRLHSNSYEDVYQEIISDKYMRYVYHWKRSAKPITVAYDATYNRGTYDKEGEYIKYKLEKEGEYPYYD